MRETDRERLISALRIVASTWQNWARYKSLLGAHSPPDEVLSPLIKEVNECSKFKEKCGFTISSGRYGLDIESRDFAKRLLFHADPSNLTESSAAEAADWFLRVLNTQYTTGKFITVIWGATINFEIHIAPNTKIVPFSSLPDTPMKKNILERGRSFFIGENLWLSPRHFKTPSIALIQNIYDFTYIGERHKYIENILDIERKTEPSLTLLQATAAGHPLMAGSWFELDDRGLDLNAYDNQLLWHFHEVATSITNEVELTAYEVSDIFEQFSRLDDKYRRDLLRSMERSVLSQCRAQIVDKSIDLVLAFEIAARGKTDTPQHGARTPIRVAQMIGGTVAERQHHRDNVSLIYKLRNAAAHGSKLKKGNSNSNIESLERAHRTYRRFVVSLIRLAEPPDWGYYELEPNGRA